MKNWECKYCARHINAYTNNTLKTKKNDHLVDKHRDELEKEFRNSWAGKGCQSCGKRMPKEHDTTDYLICPNCGHDHARYWAGFGADASTWNLG